MPTSKTRKGSSWGIPTCESRSLKPLRRGPRDTVGPPIMSLKERLKSSLIGTPLQGPARRLASWLKPRKWPAERLAAAEEERIDRLLPLVLRPDDNCVDVGGHLGSFLADFRRLAPRGRHVAVEPVPHKARWLRRKFPGVEVHELALGPAPSEATFSFMPRRSGYSGLRSRTSTANETAVELHVQVARLDDIVPADRPIRFVKVDVEGAELGVFQGATRLLGTSRPFVLFECVAASFQLYETTAEQVHRVLHDDCGLDVFLLQDWLEGRGPLDRAAFQAATTPDDSGLVAAFNFLAAPGPRSAA